MNDDQALSIDPADAGNVWSVGADDLLQSVLDCPDAPPLLRQALTGVLSWQIRNETPVRRTLTSPRLAPQWVAALLALGATVTVEAESGSLEVPLDSLLEHRGEGAVAALHVPPGGPGRRWGEAHVARTPADEPIVAAVAVVDVQDGVVEQARVALTGAWPEPVRLADAPAALAGGPLDAERIRAVAASIEQEVVPQGDFLGSEEYRRAMAGVLARRAMQVCLHQESGEEGGDE
jgi:CO/xanthine dehydrogenase FAD-binding subunit